MQTTATSKLFSSFEPRRARDICVEMLASAGITVGGPAPWDVTVHDERLWSRLLRDGRLGSIGGGADEVMLSIICKLNGTLSRPGA